MQRLFFLLPILFLLPTLSFANSGFVNGVFFSHDEVLENQQITIYTVLHNHSGEKNIGTVVFIDGETEIGSVPFSLENGVIQHAQIDYTPTLGTHNIKAEIQTDSENNIHKKILAAQPLIVLKDTDGDNIADIYDADDDNDGITDVDEITQGTNPLVKEILAPRAVAQHAVETVTDTLQNGGSNLIATIDPIAQNIAQKLEEKKKEIEEEIEEIRKQNEEIGVTEHNDTAPKEKSTLKNQVATVALSVASLSIKHWVITAIIGTGSFVLFEIWKRLRRKYLF